MHWFGEFSLHSTLLTHLKALGGKPGGKAGRGGGDPLGPGGPGDPPDILMARGDPGPRR